MRIEKKVVHTCPAYDVVTDNRDVFYIRAGDQFAMAYESLRHGTQYRTYTAGSAVAYAIENHDDPIRSYLGALERGYSTHWLNQNGVSLTLHQREREEYRLIERGQKVKFEGRWFYVELAPNHNLKLVPASA